MKTICLLESVSRLDGGIFEAELALQRELHSSEGVSVDVVGLEDGFSAADAPRWAPLHPRICRVSGPRSIGYSPELFEAMDRKADLLYAATLWRYPSLAALRWASSTRKPMICAPHGSLDSWALANSAWKKRIASLLFKDRQLHSATCLRALTHEEVRSFRSQGLDQPVCVIPNGVRLPDECGKNSLKIRNPEPGRRTLLFLGRIHPKKGLVPAIRAFSAALRGKKQGKGTSSWRLVIAGWDDGGHGGELERLCAELGLRHGFRKPGAGTFLSYPGEIDVVFWGPSYDEEKQALLESADAFILPSRSEGLPMAVLEAWASRLPVLMSGACNLPSGFERGAAFRIGTEPGEILPGLEFLFSSGIPELSAMGQKGYDLVAKEFTWPRIARAMKGVYDWLLGGGSPPDCVLLQKR